MIPLVVALGAFVCGVVLWQPAMGAAEDLDFHSRWYIASFGLASLALLVAGCLAWMADATGEGQRALTLAFKVAVCTWTACTIDALCIVVIGDALAIPALSVLLVVAALAALTLVVLALAEPSGLEYDRRDHWLQRSSLLLLGAADLLLAIHSAMILAR